MTTVQRRIVRGGPDAKGWRRHVVKAGDPQVVRDELARAAATRAMPGGPVAAFVHFTDVHVQDSQSPARFEFLDRCAARAWRSSAALPAARHAVHPGRRGDRAAVRAAGGPATGAPRVRGDHGGHRRQLPVNELRWTIALLDGGRVVPTAAGRGVRGRRRRGPRASTRTTGTRAAAEATCSAHSTASRPCRGCVAACRPFVHRARHAVADRPWQPRRPADRQLPVSGRPNGSRSAAEAGGAAHGLTPPAFVDRLTLGELARARPPRAPARHGGREPCGCSPGRRSSPSTSARPAHRSGTG